MPSRGIARAMEVAPTYIPCQRITAHYVHPLDRTGLPELRLVLHPPRQLGFLPSSSNHLPVDARRLAASVLLGDPPHAQQRIGARPKHQLLQVADPVQVPSP